MLYSALGVVPSSFTRHVVLFFNGILPLPLCHGISGSHVRSGKGCRAGVIPSAHGALARTWYGHFWQCPARQFWDGRPPFMFLCVTVPHAHLAYYRVRTSLITLYLPWQVWNSAIAIDSFSVGQELRQRGDVKGTLPRSEHGTVWKKTDSLDAYAVFRDDDIEQQPDEDDGSEVIGLVPQEL